LTNAAEQRDLLAWCVDSDASWVRVLDGPSGVGKTRLAGEVALALPADWAAGRAVSRRLGDLLDAVVACDEPTLVVVDDADTQPGVMALLEGLGRLSGQPRIRVLLVVRNARAFTANLVSRLPEALMRSWPVTHLDVIGGDGDRRRWFVEAVRAYANALGTGPALVSGFDIGPVGADGEPMMVTLTRAALAADDGGSTRAINAVRLVGTEQLAERLVAHEQRRWHEIARDESWGIPASAVTPETRTNVVLALAVLGPTEERQAIGVLRRLRLLADQPESVLSNLVRWARYLYPGGQVPAGTLVAPAPEFLAAALVATCAQPHHGELLDALDLASAAERDPGVLVRLIRAASLFPTAGELVGGVLGESPQLVVGAIEAAALVGGAASSVERFLVAGLAAATIPADAIGALRQMIGGVEWRHLRVALLRLAVQQARNGLSNEGPKARSDLASLLNNLGVSLREVGDHRQALATDREAVTLYRRLAEAEPARHTPELARSLNNLGLSLRAVGDHRQALATAPEAVTL